MIKAVVFDLDDTLISEYEYIKSGYKHIAQLLSEKINANPKNIFNELVYIFKNNPEKVFNQLLDKYEIDYTMENIKELVNEYRGHTPEIRLYDDVIPCINALIEKDIKIGLITDGYANAQKNKINSLGIEDLFDYIIVTDDYGKDFWKPSSRPFELMQEKLSVNFNEMIYIGDNPEKDFYIHSIYPIYTIRINRETSIYKDAHYLSNVKENISINNLDKLTEIIKEIEDIENHG